MGRIKAKDELYSDKTKNAVTRTEYIMHGDQWLDEALENKGRIFKESDFEKYSDCESLFLENDIVITKPIKDIKSNFLFDLQGHTITLDENFIGSYVFAIGFDVIFAEDSDKKKIIKNGKIDCNHTNTSIVHTALSWRTTLKDLIVINNRKGLITYSDTPNGSYGAESIFENITIVHSKKYEEKTTGLEIRMTDTWAVKVCPVGFFTGIEVVNGSNVIDKCHPWGYPTLESNTYPNSQKMRFGFVVKSSGNMLNNCISDTFEPINSNEEPSRKNGGIGFYILGNMHRVCNCNTITHNDSSHSNHIPYYVSDYSDDGLANMTNGCSLIGCSCNHSAANNKFVKILKPIHADVFTQLTSCNFSLNDEFKSNLLEESSNSLSSADTVFYKTRDYAQGPLVGNLTANDTFKLLISRGSFHVLYKDEEGKMKNFGLLPVFDTYATNLEDLKSKFDDIIAYKTKYGWLSSYPVLFYYYHDEIMEILFLQPNHNRLFKLDGTVFHFT